MPTGCIAATLTTLSILCSAQVRHACQPDLIARQQWSLGLHSNITTACQHLLQYNRTSEAARLTSLALFQPKLVSKQVPKLH
jgi:hypothetical protein